jgi:hypothetical protein
MSTDNERLDTNPSSNHNASRMDPDKRKAVEAMLREGTPILEIAKANRTSPNNVMAVKKSMPETTGLQDEFKATTVRNLKSFVQRASQKLSDNLDDLHVSQIPIAMGIAIDKIQTLQDQATSVVEHRFSISHDSINKLLTSRGFDLKKAKEVVIDAETVPEKPKPTQVYLDWAKNPKGTFLPITEKADDPSQNLGFQPIDPPPPLVDTEE